VGFAVGLLGEIVGVETAVLLGIKFYFLEGWLETAVRSVQVQSLF